MKEQNDQLYRAASLSVEREKLQVERDKNNPGAPSFQRSGDPNLDNLNSLENYYSYNDGIVSENKDILTTLADSYSSIDEQVAPKEALKKIDDYKNNPAENTPRNPDQKYQFDQYIRNSNILANSKAVHDKLEEQLRKEKGITSAPLNKQLEDVGDLNIPLVNGEVDTFSPQEVYTYLQKEKSKIQGAAAAERVVIDDSKLTNREKQLKEYFKNRYSNVGYSSAPSTGIASVDNYLGNISHVIRSNRKNQQAVTQELAKRMAPITGDFTTEQAGIKLPKPEIQKAFVSDLVNVIDSDLSSKTGALQYDPEVALGLSKKDGVEYQFIRKGNKNFVKMTDTSDKGNSQVIPVSEEFVKNNPSLGQSYLNKNIDLSNVMLRNGGTTNIFKDYDHAYYSTGYFGGRLPDGNRTVNLPVSADYEKSSVGLIPVFRLKVPGLPRAIEAKLSNPVDRDYFENEYLPTMTDEKIIKLFKTQYPNIEQLINQ